MKEIKKALVISGGGARGAWGVGVLTGLYDLAIKQEIPPTEYDLVVGTSTGSLIAPLAALNMYPELKDIYLNVTQDSIFNVNPFYANGNLNYWCFIYRLLRGCPTLGESKNLLKLIKKNFTQEVYDQIQSQGKVVAATVTSLTKNMAQTFTTETESLDDIIEWIWGSCSEPVFMSTLNKNGEAWVDGGVKDYLPIDYAIDRGATEIDVIVHNTTEINEGITKWTQNGGIFPLLLRTVQILEDNVGQADIAEAKLRDQLNPNIKMTVYFMSKKEVLQAENPLLFNKPMMTNIFNEGYSSVIDGTVIKRVYPSSVNV